MADHDVRIHVVTDDDTKFERARREAPHIEAFARATPSVDPDLQPTSRRRPPVSWAEMLARWSDVDEHRGGRAEGSSEGRGDSTSSH